MTPSYAEKIGSWLTFKTASQDSPEAEILFSGEGEKSEGYFIEPTIILTTNPHFVTMEEEIL